MKTKWVVGLLVVVFLLTDVFPAAAQDNFGAPEFYSVGQSPRNVVVGDFDRDGRDDVAVTNIDDSSVSVLYGRPGGGLGSHAQHAIAGSPLDLTSADLNGDEFLDLVVGESSGVSILYGQVCGFAPYCQYSTAYQAVGVAVADLDGDLLSDIAVTIRNNTSGYDELNIFYQQSGEAFGSPVVYHVGDEVQRIVIGHFNRDARPDLAINVDVGDCVQVLYQQEGGGFGSSETYPVGHTPLGLITHDFNRDGMADIATTNVNGATVTVLYGRPEGGLGSRLDLAVGSAAKEFTTADFNIDGNDDLAVSGGWNEIAVFYGQDGGTFGGRHEYEAGRSPFGIGTGDFNSDELPDLVMANWNEDSITLLYNTIPEPAALSLLVVGGLALICRRKR